MKDRKGTGLSRDKNLRVNKNAGYKFVKKDKSVNKRAGLHDKKTNIAEGERRVVRVKPLALKHKRRMRKAAVVLAAVCVGAVSYVGMGFLFKPEGLYVEDLGNYTVKAQKAGDDSVPAGGGKIYYFPEDGSLPTDHTIIENVAYLNYVLNDVHTHWSSYMESTVYTVMQQNVYTHKKSFKDEVTGEYSFVSADMAVGASNTARQFCVTEEEVIWREAAGKISIKNMDETDWNENTYYGNTISEFRSYRGLPANEFSVYILDENTVKNAGETSVKDNGDGTYTMTLDLKVHQDGPDSAVHYYKQQMYVTGGLYAWPTFDFTRVTYTFTSDWTLLSFSISDSYSAKMGVIAAACSSESTTTFKYEKEDAVNTYRKDCFGVHEDGNYIRYSPFGNERKLDAATCMANAFGSVLEEGATFKIDLNLNGRKLNGAIYAGLNDGSISDLRVAIGELKVFLGDDNGKNMLYLAAGKDKFKLCTDGLFGSEPEAGSSAGNPLDGVFDTNDLIKQLFAGEFELQEKAATLKSTLSLFGLEIPVEFAFKVRGLDASLDYVSASFSLNGSPVKARLEFGTEEDIPAAPSQSEKPQYKDILNEGITLNLKLGIDKLVLEGAAEIRLENGEFKGVNAYLGNYAAYYNAENGFVYLNLDGYKYKLDTAALAGNGGSAIPLSASGEGDAQASALQQVINFIVGGISTDGNGINFNGALAADNGFNVLGTVIKLGVDVNLRGYLGVNAKIELGGKTAVAEVSIAQDNSAIPQTGNLNEYKDVLNSELTFKVESLKIDGLELNGLVNIGLKQGKLETVCANLSNAGGDIAVYFNSSEDMLYIKAGEGIKVKLPLSALGLGKGEKKALGLDGLNGLPGVLNLKDIIRQLIENLTCGENSLATGITFDIKDFGKVNIGAAISLADGLGADVTVDILNKNVALKAGLAQDESVPELTDKQKAEYADILNEGFNVNGNLQVTVGDTTLNLAVNQLAVSLQLQRDGTVKFGFALDTRLTVKDMYFDLFLSYSDGVATVVYGDSENYFGAELDIEGGDLGKLEDALISVYNRISAVLDEIITNNPLKPTDKSELEAQLTIDNISKILSKLGIAVSLEQGGANVLEMLGIPQNGGKLDIQGLIGGLQVYSPEGSIFGITLGNLALQLKNSGVNVSADLELANSAVRVYVENLSLGLYCEPSCPVKDSDLLTADDFAEMLDYLAAAAELLIEDEYSLSANATVFEDNAVSYEVKILFEFIMGEKFPVHITLPDKDNDGNNTGASVEFDNDMYWHLGVAVDNVDAAKDDLYIDVYILDANPAVSNGITTADKTAAGNGLDVYVSVSKYGSKQLNENYAPLKVYAPVNEILTVLAAGVALLDLQNIDISEESAALQSVVSQLATLLDDALVKAYLPLTHSQFNSLGASLIPQIIGSDISTLLKDILNTLSLPAGGTEESEVKGEEPAAPEAKHYINNVCLGTSGAGDRMLRIVLNGNAIYGGGYENIVFEAYKNYAYGTDLIGGETEEVPKPVKSYITGAAISNIYYGGNKELDLDINIARSVVKQTTFDGYYDFSGISALLKATVNSATHPKANATELDKQIYGDNLTDYLLNRYYYLEGKIDLHIPVLNKNYQIGLAMAAHIDRYNDVKINLSLDIPAIQEVMQVVTNGDTLTDLTIKNGMVYIKRVQKTYWKKSGFIYSEKSYDTPVTIYRVMPVSEFSANVMDNIVFLMNLGPVVTDNIKDTTPSEPVKDVSDFGAKIGKFLKSFIYSGNSNSASWALTIKGDCVDFGTNMIGLNDIVVTLNANSRYDELTNSNLYTLTGLNIKTGLSLANLINITVNGNINYCNPQLVMGKQYKDNTVDLSEKWETLLGCDSKTLGVAASGLKAGETYTPEVIAANELWNRAIASLNGEYAGKNCLEINLSSSTGVNLGEVALYENGEKTGGITIIYGSSGLLSVAPAIPEWSEKTGFTLNVDYVGGIANGANGTLDFSNVTDFANLAINATYTPNTYKVNIIVDEAAGTVYTLDYVYGTRLPLSQYIGTTVKGEDGKVYVLDSFVLDGKKYYGDIENFNITQDVTLTANWEDVTADAEYTVTYVADGKTVATRTVKYGEKISGEIVPDFNVTGYDFAGWDFCGVDVCYGNREITAIYTPHTYTITLDASAYDGCGKDGELAEVAAEAGFAEGKLYYTYGDEAVKFAALENISGYDFVRYYVLNENGEKVDINSVYMLTEDLTVYAEFKDVRINVNLTSDIAFTYNGQTAVEDDGKFVLNTYILREESGLAAAESSEGWQFLGWWYAVAGANGETAYNNLTDALTIARPGETVETEIRALWGKANISGQSTKSGSFFKGYDYTMVSTASYEFIGYDGLIGNITRTATEYDWCLDNGLTPVMTKEVNNVNGNNQLVCAFDKLHIGSTSGIMNNWKISCRLTFVFADGTEFVLSAGSSGKF